MNNGQFFKVEVFYVKLLGKVRECNYYRDTGELQISTGLTWMLMTPPPPYFHCDTEQYQVSTLPLNTTTEKNSKAAKV